MVEISNLQVGVGIMFVLTALSMGAAIYTATAGNVSDSPQVTANTGNIKINYDNLEIVNGDISALKDTVEILRNNIDQQAIQHENDVDALKLRDTSLDAKINERFMPTGNDGPSGESSFRLELSTNRIEVGDSFKITGFDKANTPFVASMVGSDRDDVMPLNGQTRSNGEFTLDLFIPSNWQAGLYTVTVIIGENFDKITFTVVP